MDAKTSPRGAGDAERASGAKAGLSLRFIRSWDLYEDLDASRLVWSPALFVHGLPPYPPLGHFDPAWQIDPNAPK